MSTQQRLTRRWLASLALGLLSSLCSLGAQADGPWPEKPIKVILPFPPGGPSEMTMRLAAEKMQTSLKQPIVLDNRPGAGGNLGAAEVARSPADGYTFLWGTDTLATVNPHIYKSLGYKVEDLAPVTIGARFGQTLVCNPALGVKTVKELVAKAKAEKLTYASGGSGVPGHLSMELLQDMAGFDMDHVPYKGPAPATQDLLGNQVPCGLLAGPTVLPHIKSGKLVALAVSGSHRSPTLPQVPTMAEAGVPGYEANFSLVLFAPRGTPPAIMERMRAALTDALKASDVTEKLKTTDQVVVGSTTEQTVSTLAADSAKWRAVARRIKLAVD